MKKTNIEAVNKYTALNYDLSDGRLFENTDENGCVEAVLIDYGGVSWIYPITVFEALKKEILGISPESEVLEVKEDSQSTVSEDFVLKAMALVLNKESFGDLK